MNISKIAITYIYSVTLEEGNKNGFKEEKRRKCESENFHNTGWSYIAGQQHKIALAAYYKAENRGFAPGQEVDDWLEAEHDIMGDLDQ